MSEQSTSPAPDEAPAIGADQAAQTSPAVPTGQAGLISPAVPTGQAGPTSPAGQAGAANQGKSKRTSAAHPSALPVQRLRIRYAKRGRLRFSSHRDFQRALERALRRANVPMAYSHGFSPHPRVSYSNSAPTGAASEAEYVEIAVITRCDPEQIRAALDDALPPGLDVLEVVESNGSSFADRLQATHWQLELAGLVDGDALMHVESAISAFLASDSIEVQRLLKDGVRIFDCRAAVVSMSADLPEAEPEADGVPGPGATASQAPCVTMQVVVRHGTPTVRPDDVLAGLRQVAALELPVPARVTRLAQGPLDDEAGTVGDPLAPDREADPQSDGAVE